jgi:hypothetical protein
MNGKPVGPDPINQVSKLTFFDEPADPCLRQDLAAIAACGGSAPPESEMRFQTELVAVTPNGEAGQVLYTLVWESSFNGTVAGGAGTAVPEGIDVDPGSGTGSITFISINGVPVPPIVPANQVSTTASGLAYSRVTKTFNGTVTVTNTSGSALRTTTNFQLAVNGLTDGVALANSTGTFNHFPYITIPMTSLAAGQSVTVPVQFNNPSNALINFTPEFYAGSFQ